MTLYLMSFVIFLGQSRKRHNFSNILPNRMFDILLISQYSHTCDDIVAMSLVILLVQSIKGDKFDNILSNIFVILLVQSM